VSVSDTTFTTCASRKMYDFEKSLGIGLSGKDG